MMMTKKRTRGVVRLVTQCEGDGDDNDGDADDDDDDI